MDIKVFDDSATDPAVFGSSEVLLLIPLYFLFKDIFLINFGLIAAMNPCGSCLSDEKAYLHILDSNKVQKANLRPSAT
jgi:hypothetical protein